jgi:uncharacterized protein (DUF58 family)
MRKHQQQTVTSLPMSPDQERRGRMRRYAITMSIRLVCFVLCIFSQGWWQLVFIAGALVLPYVAVVLANTARRGSLAEVISPGALVVSHPVDHSGEDE